MAKSLIVFSDGTNNKGGVTHDTNVWRLNQMVDRSRGDQCTFYDDGVGTQDIAPLKIIGGAFGWGLSANIREAYSFLARNYEPGDRIYLFGFSRGAYTVRSLLGFINRCGLVAGHAASGQAEEPTSGELKERVKQAFRAYRAIRAKPAETERARNRKVVVEFIGVWDTVDAVGMPVDELRPLVSWASYLIGRRGYRFRDHVINGARTARQALSIDDERRTFHPNVWSAAGTYGDDSKPVDLKQVWFAGVHSNVGGGYPKDWPGIRYARVDDRRIAQSASARWDHEAASFRRARSERPRQPGGQALRFQTRTRQLLSLQSTPPRPSRQR